MDDYHRLDSGLSGIRSSSRRKRPPRRLDVRCTKSSLIKYIDPWTVGSFSFK